MPTAAANGIEIAYDTFGDTASPPILLIVGLGRQMVFWDAAFCEQLAAKGLRVIRFDNRDTGLTTKFEAAGDPDLTQALTAAMNGEAVDAPYSLDDMADDAVGLLDALGIENAHICGMSMGAAITQIIGYRHPDRALSLIPIMGSTGSPDLPQARPEAIEALLRPVPREREACLAQAVEIWQVLSGSLRDDPERIREKAAREYDRAFYPQGMPRQFTAILANGNRKPRLSSVTAPTLVIHGEEDPLIPVEGGRDIAEAIPNAELLIIQGMGHSLPRAAWPQIVDAIAGHTTKKQATKKQATKN